MLHIILLTLSITAVFILGYIIGEQKGYKVCYRDMLRTLQHCEECGLVKWDTTRMIDLEAENWPHVEDARYGEN